MKCSRSIIRISIEIKKFIDCLQWISSNNLKYRVLVLRYFEIRFFYQRRMNYCTTFHLQPIIYKTINYIMIRGIKQDTPMIYLSMNRSEVFFICFFSNFKSIIIHHLHSLSLINVSLKPFNLSWPIPKYKQFMFSDIFPTSWYLLSILTSD